MKFCQRLKLARKHAGLTQQGLVDKLGTAENGKPLMAQPNLAQMELSQVAKGSIYSSIIADVCGVNALWLTNEVGGMLDINYPLSDTPEAQLFKAMQNMDAATKYQLVKIGNSLAEPAENPNGTQK